MATGIKAVTEEAIAAYEESVRDKASSNVTLDLATRSIFREHGFVRVDTSKDPAVEVLDNDKIKDSIFEIAPDHVVVTKDDRNSEPIHRYALASKIILGRPAPPPYGDSDAWDAESALRRAAWYKAEQHIWKLIDDKYNAALQRMVREELEEELILVKTGDYVFLTSDPRFVQAEIYRRLTDRVELGLVAAAEQMALFEKQMPALKGKAVPALTSASKRMGDKAHAAYTLLADENGAEE
jgi:hypothetical protein